MAKQINNTVQRVEALVRPVLEELNLQLWDVRFEKEGADWFLKVFFDRDKPMDTDICELVSRAIDPLIDEADFISQSYFLEVGSPGLGRRLLKPEHFEHVKGQKVLAVLFRPDETGEREISGVLIEKTPETLFLKLENDTEAQVSAKDISYCKLCDDEDLFAKKK